MLIREAVLEESDALRARQSRAPQGTSIVVSTVNHPDFFSRVRAYASWKVFNAYDGEKLLGSGACAVREGKLGDRIIRIGYVFQIFVSPDFRCRGAARELLHTIETYLKSEDVALSYALIMEGNNPSMRLFESQGYVRHRKLVMPGFMPLGKKAIADPHRIRSVTHDDLGAIADLLNRTWEGYELFEPATPSSIAELFERTEALSFQNFFLLEENGEIRGCLAFMDWSEIMEISVLRLNFKMRALGKILTAARILPTFPTAGGTLNQGMLVMMGYRRVEDLAPLMKHVNNVYAPKGIEQVFCVCEPKDPLIQSMKGFVRVNTGVNLFTKKLRSDISIPDNAVAMTGLDM